MSWLAHYCAPWRFVSCFQRMCLWRALQLSRRWRWRRCWRSSRYALCRGWVGLKDKIKLWNIILSNETDFLMYKIVSKNVCTVLEGVVVVVVLVVDEAGSLVVAQPLPPLGTKLTAGSPLLVSLFKLGKLAGGRRAEGTFPKLCIPCLRGKVLFCWCCSKDSP